jgi:3-oxoadipate enol-lactonase
MWQPQWQTFPRRHRTLRYDMRGFGRSPIEGPPLSLAGDLVALLDGLELGPASLVGVSVGGRVALEVAVARPDLAAKLVLVGAGLPDHDWSETVKAFGAAEDAALERGDIEGAVEINLRMWVDGPLRAPDDVDSQVRRRVAEMQRRAFELQLPFADLAENLLVPDVGDRLGEVDAPVLVVVGSADVEDMHWIAERLLRELPNARQASIPDTAHLPSLEQPDAFDTIVLRFLDE